MTMKMWVKLPTSWINAGGLKEFRWDRGKGGNNIAALMCLLVIAHYADSETGEAAVTYDTMERAMGLSRAKISGGLKVLEEQKVIERRVEKRRSTYKVVGMDVKGWGALPAKSLYTSRGELRFLHDFSLRTSTELNALKLFFLFVARRDTQTNRAYIGYDKIEAYTGIARAKIHSALSRLVLLGLLHIDYIPTNMSKYGVSNAYRLSHIRPHQHNGTNGLEMMAEATEAEEAPF